MKDGSGLREIFWMWLAGGRPLVIRPARVTRPALRLRLSAVIVTVGFTELQHWQVKSVSHPPTPSLD
jgi:hypothetical protein